MAWNGNNSHNLCGEELQQQMHELIRQACGGSVENIYFQVDAKYEQNLRGTSDDGGEALYHRSIMSFVWPCAKIDCDDCNNHGSSSSSRGRQNGSDSDNSSSSGSPNKPIMKQVYSTSNPFPERRVGGGGGPSDNMGMGPTGPEAVPMEFEIGSGILEDESDFTGREEDLSDLLDFQGVPPIIPLPNDILHAAIDEQLNKASPPESKQGWDSPLFTSLATVKQEDTHPIYENGLQQSSEISSSSAIRPALQSAQVSIPNVTIPLTSQQQQHLPQFITSSARIIKLEQSQISQPAQSQQILCPANLPAVSALVSGGASFNLALARAAAGNATISTIVRLARQCQTQAGGGRTTILIPKPAIMSSNVVPRCRKNSPLPKNSRIGDDPVSQFSDKPSNTSTGYNYESWILEEGLYKIRKQGLHKKKKTDDKIDKEAYPFACPACDKRYKNPNGIKYHARYAHGPKDAFICEICKREYSTRHGLAAHRKTHGVIVSPLPGSSQGVSPDLDAEAAEGGTTTVLITSTSENA